MRLRVSAIGSDKTAISETEAGLIRGWIWKDRLRRIVSGCAVIQDLGPFSAAAHHAAGARRQNRDLREISASLFNYCQAVMAVRAAEDDI